MPFKTLSHEVNENNDESVTDESSSEIMTRSKKKLTFETKEDEVLLVGNKNPDNEFQSKRKKSETMEYPVNIDKMDDDYEHSDVYVVEIPSKEHDHPDVIAAKEKEIENLRKFDTFEEVEDIGQTTIG